MFHSEGQLSEKVRYTFGESFDNQGENKNWGENLQSQ